MRKENSDSGSMSADVRIMAHFLAKPGFLLARVDQITTALFSSLCQTVTLNQAELLLLLERLGPMAQITLARSAGVDKSTTAYILDNMQARGWVKRVDCEQDRRRVQVHLTSDAKLILPEISEHFANLQRQFESPLEEASLLRLKRILKTLGCDPLGPAPLWHPAKESAQAVLDEASSFLMRRALQSMQSHFVTATQGAGLSARQFSLLFILTKRDSITQIQFARMFGLDPSTCAVIIRGLLKRRLLKSATSPQDRRARLFCLSHEGGKALATVHQLMDESERASFENVSSEDKAFLINQLRVIVKSHSHLLRFPGAIDSL
ncbi:MarR family transcriptional regulator [Altererythrobacter indicus]|uniref:MarR family transcriptional regulator n=1 Tax=Altericroceibacterium indicum TaxID=374177 RepID=A0A845A6S9_9SPHN|nr:MarR family transcriptional regulator [Altericroceibacterium indicum]MXP24963.1 MarR family transcriptional regulator [Altericroceibacterium indicum]